MKSKFLPSLNLTFILLRNFRFLPNLIKDSCFFLLIILSFLLFSPEIRAQTLTLSDAIATLSSLNVIAGELDA